MLQPYGYGKRFPRSVNCFYNVYFITSYSLHFLTLYYRSLWPDLDVDGSTAESFAEFATTNVVSDLLDTEKGKWHVIGSVFLTASGWLLAECRSHSYAVGNYRHNRCLVGSMVYGLARLQ